MPDFQDNDFPLFHGQFGQTAHRRAFVRGFVLRTIKPAARFQLARQPAPQAAAIIQRPVAKAAHAITLRLHRRLRPPQERNEGFLEDILRFIVAQAQSPAVEKQLRGLRFIKPFAPTCFGFHAHTVSLDRHRSSPICIKFV